MARGSKKNKSQQQSIDPKKRVETRQQRKERLAAEQEAAQVCEKILPYFGALVFLFIIGFFAYVRSLPERIPLDPATANLRDIQEDMAFQILQEDEQKEALIEAKEKATAKALLEADAIEDYIEDEGDTMEL